MHDLLPVRCQLSNFIYLNSFKEQHMKILIQEPEIMSFSIQCISNRHSILKTSYKIYQKEMFDIH
jgi:hypothetical protein